MELDGSGASLPEEIIFDVLSWLPVKSLIRFRSVSKGWRALISSPLFIATHKSRAVPLLVGSFAVSFRSPVDYVPQLRVMDMDGNVLRVLKNVAGTVLSPTRLDLFCVDDGATTCRVIDPSTGRVVSERAPNLLDCLKRPFSYRLGRAAPSGAYKVLRIGKLISQEERVYGIGNRCEIATLQDGSTTLTWRGRQGAPFEICPREGCTVAISGLIYFLAQAAHVQYGVWNRIARFHLENEDWKTTIDGPTELRRAEPGQELLLAIGELKSTLIMVETVRSTDTSAYIWFLVDSESSMWVKRYTIQTVNSLYHVKPLEVLRDGRLLLLLKTFKQQLFADTNGMLQLYNPNTDTCTDLMDMPREFKGEITLYTGSLLS